MWITFSIFLGLVLAVALGFAMFGRTPSNNQKTLGFGIAAAVLVVYILGTVGMMATKVDPGQVGVVRSFGQIEPTVLSSGLTMIAPWKDVTKVDIKAQKKVWANDDKADFPALSAGSKDIQAVGIALTVNYNTSGDNIVNLISTVGPNYFEILVPSRINQVVKTATAQYAATDIPKNRENIRRDIVESLRKELKPYSIFIIDVLIDDISFTKDFQNSVEAKVKAEQDAQRAVAEATKRQTEAQSEADALLKQREAEAEAQVTTATAAAKARVAEATAEAEATRLAANAEADANRKIAASVTDELIKYRTAEGFGRNSKVLVLPSNGNYLFDPSKMLNP